MLFPLISRIIILVFGVLHPSYKTYKAIRHKDYQHVVILGMYWVVFSLFSTVELFTDIFLQWFPFYHEIKVGFVLWLVAPATGGSSLLYRRLIHRELSKRETEIDDAINKVSEKGYTKVVEVGAKAINYAAKTVLSTALLGQDFLADQLRRRSASMMELDRLNHPHFRTNRTGSLMYGSQPSTDLQPSFNHPGGAAGDETDDPFALNWMIPPPGSTNSLNKNWRLQYAGLENLPESGEQSHETSFADTKPPIQPSHTTTKQGGVAHQAYLRMVASQKTTRSNSLPLGVHTPYSPASPFASRGPRLPRIPSQTFCTTTNSET